MRKCVFSILILLLISLGTYAQSPPSFTSIPVTDATQDLPYSYTATATDPDVTDVLTFSAPVLPTWLNFDAGTQLLSGTPANDDVGDHDVTLTVTDGTNPVDQTFTITVANVNDAPVINTTPTLTTAEDAVYTYIFSASDVDVGDVLTYSVVGTLPAWLTFTPATGILTGTPLNGDVGDHAVTLRVYDGTVNVDQPFTITVTNTNDPPVINTTPTLTTAEDAVYTYIFSASDVDVGDVLTYSVVGTLPAWLTFTPATGILTGTPLNGDVGDHAVTLRVYDGTVNVDQPFTITVTNTNDPPVFTSLPILAATEDAVYTYTALATDVDVGDVLTYSAVAPLPAWLTFTPATRTLTGTPLNADVGDHNVTLRVNDGTVNVDQAFVITVSNVNDAPTFTSSPVTAATQDSPYSYTATASDPDVGDVLTFSAPVIPGWLTFDAGTHLLSGTPTNDDVGGNPVTISVYDGTVTVNQNFTINVANVNDAPVVVNPIPDQVLDEHFGSIQIIVATVFLDPDGDGLTLSVASDDETVVTVTHTGNHITISEVGLGSCNVTLTAFDGEFYTNDVFTVTVNNVNDAPTFTSTPVTNATQDLPYTYTATATDLDAGDVLTFSAPLLPGWLSFDGTTHVLSGTPANDDVGNHPVTISVNDGTVTVNQNFTIAVANVNDPPAFTSIPVTGATQGTLYSYTVTAEDIDGNPLVWSTSALPGWLSFDGTTHLLSGTPANGDVGDHPVTISIFDGTVTVNQDFTITVANVNDAPAFTSMPDTMALEDTPYSSAVAATDMDGDNVIFSAPLLPLWLAFDETTHILSGTPLNEDVGDHNVTLRISDGTVQVDSSFVIHVLNANDAPTFASMPDTMALEDNPYLSAVTATDVDLGDSIIFSAPVLPLWLTFNDTTAVLSGTPLNEDVGDHNVTLRISDGTVLVDSSFVIHVINTNDAPVFTSMPDTMALEDTPYLSAVTATDVDVGDNIIFSAPVLPAWLNFNDITAVLSGTPLNEDVGDNNVTLRIFDGTVQVDSSFVIHVINTNDAPSFTSIPETMALEDALYISAAVATDVDGDSIMFSAPVLPLWLTFNDTTHILTGTPLNEDVGDNSVTLRITDGTDQADSSFIIHVINTNDAPSFTSMPDTVVLEDALYSSAVAAMDVDVGDSIIYSAPVLPAWLDFNDITAVLSGTPLNEDVGFHTVTLRIFDGTVQLDSSFVIHVVNTNDPPAFSSSPVVTVLQDALYTYTAVAGDVDIGDILVYSARVVPDWLTFNPATHILRGTPDNWDVGNNVVTLSVSDGTVTVDQTFLVNVINVNDAPTFTSRPDTVARPGSPYVYIPTGIDIDGDNFTITAPLLPSWLIFNASTTTLSATPGDGDVGYHNVTVRISDGHLYTDQSFVIEVGYGNHAPTFLSDPSTSATVGSDYTYTMNAVDIDGDQLTYSAPLLPGWLTFHQATHSISGAPGSGDLGTHNVTVRVTDGTVSADQAFHITVRSANVAPAFTSTPVTDAKKGYLYIYQVTATDVDGDPIIYSAPELPDWLSLDINTHVLSGTPDESDLGNHDVILRVSDGDLSVDQLFTILVADWGVGIPDQESPAGMAIYPNPTNGRFIVELNRELNEEATLEIFDLAGKVLVRQVIPAHQRLKEEFDLSDRPAGLYFIRILHPSDYMIGKVILH